MAFNSDIPLQTNQLPISIDFPEDPAQLRDTLSLSYKRTVDAVNTKEGSLYLLDEQASFIQYFPTVTSNNNSRSLKLRSGYRMVYDLVDINGGPIPVGVTVLGVPADQLITGITDPTRIYGACTTAGPIYRPIPTMTIDVWFDNTVPAAQTITITNNTGSPMSQAYLVFEYLKEV